MKILAILFVLAFSTASFGGNDCTTLISKYLTKYNLGTFYSAAAKTTFDFNETAYDNEVNAIVKNTGGQRPQPSDYLSPQDFSEAMENYMRQAVNPIHPSPEYTALMRKRSDQLEALKKTYHLDDTTDMFTQAGRGKYDGLTYFGGAGDTPPKIPSIGVFSEGGKYVGMVIHISPQVDDVLHFTDDNGQCAIKQLSKINYTGDGGAGFKYVRADGCQKLEKMRDLALSLPLSEKYYRELLCTGQGGKLTGYQCKCAGGKEIYPTNVENDEATCLKKRKLTDADRLEHFFDDTGMEPNDGKYGLAKLNDSKTLCTPYSEDWSKSYTEAPTHWLYGTHDDSDSTVK